MKVTSRHPAVAGLVFVAMLLGFLFCLVAAVNCQEKGPQQFLGFKAYSTPAQVKSKIEGLRVVKTGRMDKTNCPFITVAGYVDPNGEKAGILSLIFSNETYPKLIAVVGTGKTYDFNHALLILAGYEKQISGTMSPDDVNGYPSVEREWNDGTYFFVGLLKIDEDQFVLISFLSWGNNK